MRVEYLIAGILLAGLGVVQVWFNGLWPFKIPRNMPAYSAASAWGLWTKVVGYVAVAAGVVCIVLAFVMAG